MEVEEGKLHYKKIGRTIFRTIVEPDNTTKKKKLA